MPPLREKVNEIERKRVKREGSRGGEEREVEKERDQRTGQLYRLLN